jgi:A118 family predicted phage portal protein
MFQKILQWIKGVFSRMIGQNDVKTALKVDVAISPEMSSALQQWALMYENKAGWLSDTVKSLNLPAAIAGEIARAVTIEMKVAITGSPRADFLTEQFQQVMPLLRAKVESGCALGGLMLKPFISGKKIAVDFIQADQFFPVKFDNSGNMTACIFADQRTIGQNYFTRLEYHSMTDTGYVIKNLVFKSSTRDTLGQRVTLAVLPEWAGLQEEATITNIDRPLFAYFKYPLANNMDKFSPLGVSCYSRAVDLIRQADEIWSNLIWEFESGKRALYVDVSAFDKDKDGKPVLRDRRLFRTLNGMNPAQVGEESFFHEWSPEFREASIKSGLNSILQRIEFTCGLAYGTLSDPQAVEKTATEIAVSKQRTYATITDAQKALRHALEQLLYATDTWATLYNLAPAGAFSTAFDFDDSIVVDKDLQFQQDLRVVSQGIMSKLEFRMRNFGEDEKTARAKLALVQDEQPTDLFQNAQGD